MSLGTAAVYKHIPVYYPKDVGAVGGIVGMIGGLGGFILPICFGIMNDLIGVYTSCFMLLFTITGIALVWMHVSILIMEKDIVKSKFLPELNRVKTQNLQRQKSNIKRIYS
jgi:NNP family nitrate/nitrite transporter-like MFS transporter